MKAFFDYVMSSLALSLMYTIYMDRIWKFPCVLVDGNVATHTHTQACTYSVFDILYIGIVLKPHAVVRREV